MVVIVLECLLHVNLAGRKGVFRGARFEAPLEAFWSLLKGLGRSLGGLLEEARRHLWP